MSEFIELDESDINTIEVYAEPLELYKLLKIANLVGGGGEAKMLISEGYVGVNGELCQQKRKKIYQGDLVEFNGEFLQIRLVEAPAESPAKSEYLAMAADPASKPSTKTASKKKAKSGKASRTKSDSGSEKRSRSGRRSISF